MQLTPPGSQRSIQIGNGITHAKPGTYQGLYLIMTDRESTRVMRAGGMGACCKFSVAGC